MDFYDQTKGSSFERLVINLGSDELPRISCAAHKLNLCLRGAFVKHQTICKDIKTLNRMIERIRKSYDLSRVFHDLKARLRLENTTRWGSAYISLLSIKRACKKNAIQLRDLPVSLGVINTYIKILKPAYIFNLELQSQRATISYIIPSILRVSITKIYVVDVPVSTVEYAYF